MHRLTLSGWTQPADALLPLAPGAAVFDYSEYASPEASFSALAQFKHAEHVIAWSMGGQLALRAIAAGVLAPRRLTLIAAPWQFVTRRDGMDPTTFEQFRANYAQNPARTKTRFHALVAKGDRYLQRVMAELTHHHAVEDTPRWLPWLDELGRASLEGLDFSRVPPTLIVHGAEDAIVPVAQGEKLAALLPNATLRRWEGAGHAPHVHDLARLRAEIAAHHGESEAA